MPVTSKRQWRKFHVLYNQGKISKAKLDEWTEGVDYDSLPEVGGKKKRKKQSKRRKRKR